jgi:hypothetical protein
LSGRFRAWQVSLVGLTFAQIGTTSGPAGSACPNICLDGVAVGKRPKRGLPAGREAASPSASGSKGASVTAVTSHGPGGTLKRKQEGT